jgi:hypothetical protein
MYLDRARITSVSSLNAVSDEGLEMLATIRSEAKDLDQHFNEKQAIRDFELVASRANLSPDDRLLVLSRIDDISYQELESKLPSLRSPRSQCRSAMERLRKVAHEMDTPPSLCAA